MAANVQGGPTPRTPGSTTTPPNVPGKGRAAVAARSGHRVTAKTNSTLTGKKRKR